jgi:hypothetical protein
MNIILDTYLQFCQKNIVIDKTLSCFFHAVRTVLSYYSGEFVDEIICAAALHALNIKYVENSYIGYDFEDVASLGNFEFKRNQSPNNIDFVVTALAKNSPVICFINSKNLRYHSIYGHNKGALHAVIIYGIDLQRKTAFLYDPHIRLNDVMYDSYSGEVQLDNLNCVESMLAIERKAYHFDSSAILRMVIEDLRFFNRSYPNRGFSVINRLVGDCKKLLALAGEEFNSACISLNYDIKINGPCYVNDFLIQIADRFNYPWIDNATEMNKLWISNSNKLLLFSQGRVRNLNKTFEDFVTLLRREKQLLVDIENHLQEVLHV